MSGVEGEKQGEGKRGEESKHRRFDEGHDEEHEGYREKENDNNERESLHHIAAEKS